VAELVFFSGTMDCGKSTLALQMHHNHAARGRDGVLFTRNDRAGAGTISSRLGLVAPAREVDDGTDFWGEVITRRTHGRPVDYLVCDEAQFYTATQVDQLARVVDELGVDIFAFGISTDFRARLFPGASRLVELADRVDVLQVRALCWCGARATHNARTVGGVMIVEGDQVVVGDVAGDSAGAAPQHEVQYEVLCRRHHMRRMTAAAARAAAPSAQTLAVAVEVAPGPDDEHPIALVADQA
jgi:thymidine kinase